MVVWIVIGVVVLAIAAWAFWPHRRGVVDGDVRRSQMLDQGRGENYNNPSGPNFNGRM